MTYEQGGSGRAGLAVEKADGDTLTLRQRIDHHVAASIATLESVADRAPEVVKAFGEYFDKARNSPVGPYKSYIIKSNGDAGRMNALRQMLDRNQIRYGFARSEASGTGAATATGEGGRPTRNAPARTVLTYDAQGRQTSGPAGS